MSSLAKEYNISSEVRPILDIFDKIREVLGGNEKIHLP
jgi:hypothetical protein